jgi:glycerol-3-phosphate O-acyltransferase
MIPNFLKKRIFKAPVVNGVSKVTDATDSAQTSAPNQVATSTYSKAPINQLYRKISGQALDVVVKPKLLGELPEFEADDQTLTFYVLQDYSRSNSILIDLQTQEYNLPPALVGVKDSIHHIDENAAIIFLHHPKAKNEQLSPRLARLIAATLQYPEVKIRLLPVSILWGRAPEKEDSLFKLLMTDNWQDPSITKQLFNIGVMGRDTFVQFHPPQNLRAIIHDSLHDGLDSDSDKFTAVTASTDPLAAGHTLVPAANANRELVRTVQQQMNVYLDKQRASMLGPDLSDKRNLVDKLIYSPAIRHAIESEASATSITVRDARSIAKGYAN